MYRVEPQKQIIEQKIRKIKKHSYLYPTFRFWIFFFITIGFFLTAIWRSNDILGVAVPIFLLIMLFSLVYIIIISMNIYIGFGFENKFSQKNKDVSAIISITNRTFLPIFLMSVFIDFETDTIEKSNHKKQKKSSADISCRGMSHGVGHSNNIYSFSGLYHATAKYIKIYDFFGFFCFKYIIALSDGIAILPWGICGSKNLSSYANTSTFLTNVTRFGSERDDFFDLRVFAEGDAIKDIHWKLSAKSDDFLVIRHTSPEKTAFCVICDNSICIKPTSTIDEQTAKNKNYACIDSVNETVYAIAKLTIKKTGLVKLLWNGGKGTATKEAELESLVCNMILSGAKDFEPA
ncbi:MAG: DUF58 domain-containing protein, partial [Clostridia bacterium]